MRNLVLLFLLLPALGSSQNLVPNPSFEEFSICPNATGDFPVLDWTSWQYTPDYFNTCNNDMTGWVGVPENTWGFQFPITGDAYSALYSFALGGDPNVREYMAAQLIEPLVVGQTYYIFFYASQIEGETGTYPQEYRCATNHIGLRFFKDPLYNNTDNVFQPDNFAHLDCAEVLADSDNWIKIEGWFTADDNYNWVALGNFFDDDQIQFEIQNEFGNCSAAYYIENICIATDSSECDYLVNSQELKQANDVSVFPNPTEKRFTIESSKIRLIAVNIYNNLGELQHSELLIGKTKEVDVSNWPIGLYQIVVRDENNSIQTFKILKQ